MATKAAARTQEPVVEEHETVEARKQRIAALQAQIKAERTALKAEKQSGTPLERVEARQQHNNGRLELLLARMLRNRLSVGQERGAAEEAVATICRNLLAGISGAPVEQAGDDDADDDEQ